MFVKKTLEEQIKTIVQQVCTSLGIDAELITDASMIHILSKVQAGAITELYSYVEYLIRQSLPIYAEEEGLRAWGYVKNVEWITSRVASGSVDAGGEVGAVILEGTLLTNTEGKEYKVLQTETIDASHAVTLGVESVEGGLDKNAETGEVLTFISTPEGVDNETIVSNGNGITGGTDTWTLEQYRTAILQSFSEPARGGSKYDYIHWTKQVVDAVSVFPLGYADDASITKGDVVLYFLMDPEEYVNGIPSATERGRVEAYINDRRPLGMGEFTVPALSTQEVTYSIKITPLNETTKANVVQSLKTLHNKTAPGATLTTGQINRAISDSPDVSDFKLIAPTADVSGTLGTLLVIDPDNITWS